MKMTIKLSVSMLSILLIMGACTKEGLRGPAGTSGETGIQGPKGDQGLDGTGNANVLKYTFDVDLAEWTADNLGVNNAAFVYQLQASDINNVDLTTADYTIFAYATLKPSTYGYPHRKMLPYTYSYNGASNVTMRIDLILNNDQDPLPKITFAKTVVNGASSSNVVPLESEMPATVTFDIFLIKLTDLAAANGLRKDLQYEDLNKIYQQRN